MRLFAPRTSASLAVIALACACSHSNFDLAPSDVTPGDGCAVFAEATCDRIDTCASFLLQSSYGDIAKCRDRVAYLCMATFGAPGSRTIPSDLGACAAATKTLGCGDFLLGVPVPACNIPGGLKLGQPCVAAHQCESLSCDVPGGSACGRCTVGTPATACKSTCAPGLVCAKNEECAKPAGPGDPCEAKAKPCVSSASCVTGTCEVNRNAPTEICDGSSTLRADCNYADGLYCVAGRCKAIVLGAAGQECGLGSSTPAVCRGALYCANGLCAPSVSDSSACDPTREGMCLARARCVGGLCQLPHPADCK